MNVVDKLWALLSGESTADEKNLVDAEVCPNCWGKQQYANEYREATKDVSKASHEKKAFIEKFVEKNITGIKLKHQDDKLVCSACDGVYKNSPTNAN